MLAHHLDAVLAFALVFVSGGGPGQQGAGDGRVGVVDGEGALAAETRHTKRGGGVTGYPTGKSKLQPRLCPQVVHCPKGEGTESTPNHECSEGDWRGAAGIRK